MMQAWSSKGNGQMKYARHCCNFIRETANIVNRVPILPQDIDIVIVRPKDQDQEQSLLAASDCFRLRRRVVEDYIRVLQQFHPSFRTGAVAIDFDALHRLPDDQNVYDQIRSITETEPPPENPGPNDLNEGNNNEDLSTLVTDGFVPQLRSREIEMAALESGLNVTEMVLTMPQLLPQPINEHNPTLRYIIDAFPVLFPTGTADIHERRPCKVTTQEYFTHLI